MSVRILVGDCRDVLRTLPDESVHCVVTSPPYWGLRDYGVAGQIGLEASYGEFVEQMVGVFGEVRRVLPADGTCWLNLGDSYARDPGKGDRAEYLGLHKNISDSGCHTASQSRTLAGLKPKDLVGVPWRVAFALQADGWWLRQDIIWSKPNPMPESVTDRCTKAHEYIFMLSKSERYYYDNDAVREPYNETSIGRYLSPMMATAPNSRQPGGDLDRRRREEGIRDPNPLGRNRRSVWTVPTQPFSEAHFATFPPALIEPCILAGCPEGGTVLDPFGGAGTTALVADRLRRNAILIELNPAYAEMAQRRIRDDAGMFASIDTDLTHAKSGGDDKAMSAQA